MDPHFHDPDDDDTLIMAGETNIAAVRKSEKQKEQRKSFLGGDFEHCWHRGFHKEGTNSLTQGDIFCSNLAVSTTCLSCSVCWGEPVS